MGKDGPGIENECERVGVPAVNKEKDNVSEGAELEGQDESAGGCCSGQ